MPIVDKPIEELLQYHGRTPRPSDFDEFWEKSLQEMRSVERNVELVKADFQVPGFTCYDMYFTGVRNARIHCQLVVPDNIKDKAPAILQFHGYSGWTGEFSHKLNLASCGFVVAAMDCRGQGGFSEDTGGVKGTTQNGQIIRGLDDCPENLLFRHIFLDTAELADIVMNFDKESVIGIHDLIVHDYGPGRRIISLHAEVPAEGNMMSLHDVIDNLEMKLRAELGCLTTIHIDPVVTTDERVKELKEQCVELVRGIGDKLTLHDFRVVFGDSHTNMIFDVVVPFEFYLSDGETIKMIQEKVWQKFGKNYFVVITIDKPAVKV